MKKLIYSLLLAVISMTVFISCSKSEKVDVENTKIKVITTIFPPYDFVRQIASDEVEVSMLLKPGAESHSFEPSPADIIAIQNCDMFVYVGGENDVWVDNILDSMELNNKKIVKLMDCVTVVEEELVEGMESDHDHEHEHEEEGSNEHAEEEHTDEEHEDTLSDEGHDHEHEEVEYDEHVWTSPKNAILITKQLEQALSELDESKKEIYEENAAAYIEKLNALDEEFTELVSNAKRTSIVVGDRFPFRYFADAYGLSYSAAFSGCSSETEASAATIAYLIDQVKREEIPVVFYIEFSNGNIANIICEETGAKTLLLHSCHNITRDDFNKGVGYLDLMEQNVINLKEALY